MTMDQFEILDDFESCFAEIISGNTNESIEDELAITYNSCPQCNIPMAVKTNNQYICSNCGLLNESIEVVDMNTTTSNMNYNSMSIGLRCVGANAHRYQTILRSQSNNEASPEVHIRNILFSYNHKIGKDGMIPKYILLNVLDQFKYTRMEGTIYRGTILRAIIAAMTYYECLRHKLLFKPCDIYSWFDVDSQTYSKGDKKVHEMLDHGFLSDDLREINAEHSYLNAYATKLELDETTIEFLEELMNFVADNKLLNPNAKSTTRALCVLHLYLTAVKHPIKPEDFKKIFKCNYGTIRTISLDLFHESKRLIPIFKKYDIAYDNLNSQTEKSKKIVNKRRARNGRVALD